MKIIPLVLIAGTLAACGAESRAGSRTGACDAQWTDTSRDRPVPVRIRLPEGQEPAPVIIFSHGLGGSLDGGTAWAEHWRTAGFAVVNVQHPGSDRSALRRGLLGAMSGTQLQARARDIIFVIDSLERKAGAKARDGECDLSRLDMARIGMSGHSFGAHTTQALAGQSFPGADLSDPRIDAAVALSPAPPLGGSIESAFANVRIPFFSITGTEDKVAFLPQTTPELRTQVFGAMPAGGKFLLVLAGAEHADMGGPGGDGEARPALRRRAADATPEQRALRQHFDSTIKEATTDFWRWTLREDAAAKARLDSLGGRLRPGDRFEGK